MAFTRFHDDPCRIKKQLQESTDSGRYMLNKPGWGDKPCFMNDPQIRMQQWGGNLRTNTINLESDLMGLTRSTNRDCIKENNFKTNETKTQKVNYPTLEPITDQTRATHPAWTYRDLEQVNWYTLPLNPQENVCLSFQNNLNTRLIERDSYVACPPRQINNI